MQMRAQNRIAGVRSGETMVLMKGMSGYLQLKSDLNDIDDNWTR